MEIQGKCVKVFTEIDTISARLSELGREAKLVLAEMINSGESLDSVDFLLAKARKAEQANLVDEFGNGKQDEAKETRRCKWWNRGYCREKERCLFIHPKGDCQDHLQGRCTSRGCTLQHRKVCKFIHTRVGCLRGEDCAYLHPAEEVTAGENNAENGIPQLEENKVQDEGNKINSKKSETPENVVNDLKQKSEKKSSDNSVKKVDTWIHCKKCDYKCKKKNTMRKHVNTKHSQFHKCYSCGEMFNTKDSLEAHREKIHGEEETVKDTSFVFSESMLDEFF